MGGNNVNGPIVPNLSSLTSGNARWFMQHAHIERFAVDDCITILNSEDFKGWAPHEILTTIQTDPLPLPDDLATIQQEKRAHVDKRYVNDPHYRLVSAIPVSSELHITLAPLRFYDYFSLHPYLDEPLVTAFDGSPTSIRQKYSHTALSSAKEKATALIPAPISIQCIVITEEQHLLLAQRALSVAFYPNHWSASFEETMDAPSHRSQSGDRDFFAGAIRGLDEEFAIKEHAVEDIRVLSLNVEYPTLSVDVFVLIRLHLTLEEIKRGWMGSARHRDEASRITSVSIHLSEVVDRLFSETLWHPTSRMRLIQFLFCQYGVKEVVRAIQARYL